VDGVLLLPRIPLISGASTEMATVMLPVSSSQKLSQKSVSLGHCNECSHYVINIGLALLTNTAQ
jgi:hypothetical protein